MPLPYFICTPKATLVHHLQRFSNLNWIDYLTWTAVVLRSLLIVSRCLALFVQTARLFFSNRHLQRTNTVRITSRYPRELHANGLEGFFFSCLLVSLQRTFYHQKSNQILCYFLENYVLFRMFRVRWKHVLGNAYIYSWNMLNIQHKIRYH